MISEKINRDNKREEKKDNPNNSTYNISINAILCICRHNGRCKDKKWFYLQDNKKSG